jgi:hypothetical protein
MKSSTRNLIIIILSGLLLIGGCGYIDFKIWRAGHPDAPTWVYFFKGKHK